MAIPRDDANIAARVKKLEDELRRIKLTPTTTQTAVAPAAAVKGAVWIDSSAGNEPKVWDGTAWVPVRDQTIAVAQTTADQAAADVAPLVPLTDLAAVTSGTTITGATVAAATTGARAVLNDPAYPGEMVVYSGKAGELTPARYRGDLGGNYGYSEMRSPALVTDQYSYFELDGYDDGSTTAVLSADLIKLEGGHTRVLGFTSGVVIGNDFIAGERIKVEHNQIKEANLTDATNVFPGQMLTQVLVAAANANLDVTTTEADVPGATVTFTTTKANAKFLCVGSFYFSMLLANSGVASGKLSVDGSVQSAFANFTGLNTVPDRGNMAQNWSGTLAAAGSHTLKLRGVGSAAAPNPAQRINSGSTTIIVLVFE